MSRFIFFHLFLILLHSNSTYAQISSNRVKTGFEVLIEGNYSNIKGSTIGVFTNFSGRTSGDSLSIEILSNKSDIKIKCIFTPEHGFWSTVPAGASIADDTLFGIKVYSLYGRFRKPSEWMLSGLDIILVDIQDIGIRSYTYISSLFNIMEAAAISGVKVLVCDRPNPLGGLAVDGNILDDDVRSFIGIIPLPYIHGMTIGEIAKYINDENLLNKDLKKNHQCKLEIIRMEGWQRWMQWEDTGLKWYPTSPNIPSVNALRGAAMTGFLGELGLFNLGVGTQLPFQIFSYNGLEPVVLNDFLSQINFEGVRLHLTKIGSKAESWAYLLQFEPSNLFQPYSYGFELAMAARSASPTLFKDFSLRSESKEMFMKATGSRSLLKLIQEGSDDEVRAAITNGLLGFVKKRASYLLY